MKPPLSRGGAGVSATLNDGELQQRFPSRAGSYTADRYPQKTSPHHERVLYPTQVKESFLQRNKHMASAKMEQMAREFAQRALQ